MVHLRYIPEAGIKDEEGADRAPKSPRIGQRTAVELTVERIKALRHSGRTYQLANGKEALAREIVWDRAVPGLGLRLAPSGRHSWVVRYRLRQGWRIATLGAYGRLTLKGARDAARVKTAEHIKTGVDPFARAARGLPWPELAERVWAEYRVTRKPATLVSLRHALAAAAKDFGSRPVDEITHRDVVRAVARWTREKGPIAANTYLAFVSKAFQIARRQGFLDTEKPLPSDRVQRNPTARKRELNLSPGDIERLGVALAQEEAGRPEAADAVRAVKLLALTGCRRREITLLRWREVDLEGGAIRLTDSKTGPRLVPLSTAPRALLASLDRGGPDDLVLPQAEPRITYAWRRIRERAGLPGLRLHDWRHHHISVGLSAGFSLALVGRIAGHTNPSTTARYEHVQLDPLRGPAERISSSIAAMLEGEPKAEVVELPRLGA
ncbi:MAG TPA: site-specific integrase [Thermoanaerobaculia bacterium]|jgi:integrase|nr:MAG: putative prophage CPS-53 integrase [Acidobacteria bacterium ADurb.Bin051]HNU82845.1 site-specific integrase [Thermoanaerobaculia bacterium]